MIEHLLGINIKKLRKHHKLTQEQLADIIGAKKLQISRWEQGTVVPDSYMIQRISDYFNIPVHILIRGIITFDENINITDDI